MPRTTPTADQIVFASAKDQARINLDTWLEELDARVTQLLSLQAVARGVVQYDASGQVAVTDIRQHSLVSLMHGGAKASSEAMVLPAQTRTVAPLSTLVLNPDAAFDVTTFQYTAPSDGVYLTYVSVDWPATALPSVELELDGQTAQDDTRLRARLPGLYHMDAGTTARLMLYEGGSTALTLPAGSVVFTAGRIM